MISRKRILEILKKYRHSIGNFVHAICFVVVSLFIVNLISWAYRANNIESREEIIGLHNVEGDVDVLTFGSSNLLRFFNPLQAYEDYGITSYNYATVLGQLDLMKYYIEEAEKYKNPKLYVLNVGGILYMSEEFSEQGLRNWSDSLDIWNPVRLKSIHSYLASHEDSSLDVLSYYFDLSKYHGSRESLGNRRQYELLLDTYHNTDRGFSACTDFQPFDMPEICDDIGDLTKQEQRAVTELLDYCDKKELNVLFMVSPFILQKADWLKLNAVEELVSERGYKFVNFNRNYEEIGLDFSRDYFDKGHVNYFGAEKFTDYFADYLKKNYRLPDHRDGEDYRSWNEDVVLFKETMNEWRKTTESNINSAVKSRDNSVDTE